MQDEDGDGVCLPDCSEVTCGHGACEITGGVAGCACEPGYTGETCDTLDAPDASSVAFWLDASDATTTGVTGDFLTSWADKGADELTSLVDADDAAKPTLVANALNGLPVVRFDGEGDYVRWNDFAGITDEPAYTIFLVATAGLEGSTFLSGTEGDNRFEVRTGAGGTLVFTHEPAAGDPSEVASASGWSMPAAHVVTVRRTNSRMSVWVDGRFRYDAPTADGVALDANVDLFLGTGPAGDLPGDVAEVLIVDEALDFAGRRAIEAYLGAKWLGAAPAVDPTSIVAASLWLDASDDEAVTAVGGAITGIANLGYEGGFLEQGAFPEMRPALVASALNGRAVARFDGGDVLGPRWRASTAATCSA